MKNLKAKHKFMTSLNTFIDHTLLKASATPEDILKLCSEAQLYNFHAVCVNSCYVHLASNLLKESDVKVAATVGFPLGAVSKKGKVSEAKRCVKEGADEIDMVMNLGFFKGDLQKSVREEISAVKKAIDDAVLKVIIETCELSPSEIKMACSIVIKAGADFVKTSTGFGTGGAALEDVRLIKEYVGEEIMIKASGGIRSAPSAMQFIEAGVHRIGTSSGVSMMESLKKTPQ